MKILAAMTPDESWSPGIGHLTVVGWLTVMAYFSSAALCARAAYVEQRRPADRRRLSPLGFVTGESGVNERAFWWFPAIVLLILGINKQLDLQTALTNWGRDFARDRQWYEVRQPVQLAFIAIMAMIGAIGLIAFCWFFRRAADQYRLAVVGLFYLVTFVTIRAASFHQIDAIIYRQTLGVRWNWVFELGGIAMIAVSAVACLRSQAASGSGTVRVPLQR